MISKKAYQKRRQHLIAQLPQNAIAVVTSGEERLRNGDVHYPFRASSDFLYLTGFTEPSAILLLSSEGILLFNQSAIPAKEIWTGPVLGQERAVDELGVDKAYPISAFEEVLSALLIRKSAVYYPFLQTGGFEKTLFHTCKKARTLKRGHAAMDSSFCDLSPYLARMRLYKSPEEYQCLQQAVDVSVKAHLAVMENIGKLSYEYEAVAIFHQSLQSQGLMETAYPSIVASGPNACVLHYTQSNRKFLPNDLLLIDAGAEYLGYAADITRTYPINGQWQGPAEAIYNLVLEAQLKAIGEVKAKNPWSKMQETVIRTLTQGLMDLGILTGSLDGLIEQKAYKSFYMHNSGHWLGLDVHDVGTYENVMLAEGMVLTVEPGLYISPHARGIDERFLGIGVRIEDDVYLSEKGPVVLSHALPKTVTELKTRLGHA